MTPTERLRELLDERGVEWWPSDERWNADVITHWYAGLFKWTAIEGEDGLWVNAGVAGHNPLTPEQAIAATLGLGTCHDAAGKQMAFFACSACGATIERKNPRFCYGCGRQVMSE